METKTNVLNAQQEQIQELHTQQEKLKKLLAELEVMESKLKNNEKLSREDIKFSGELGWLSAAAVAIASIAVSLQ